VLAARSARPSWKRENADRCASACGRCCKLRPLFVGVSAFELGNVAATLLILRATDLLTPGHGHDHAVEIALLLYAGYNLAATLVSIPAGLLSDRRGTAGMLVAGAVAFLLAYGGFALTVARVVSLALCFAAAGVGIGCA
jgi:MFS family permease